jgi:hypothetical protein
MKYSKIMGWKKMERRWLREDGQEYSVCRKSLRLCKHHIVTLIVTSALESW